MIWITRSLTACYKLQDTDWETQILSYKLWNAQHVRPSCQSFAFKRERKFLSRRAFVIRSSYMLFHSVYGINFMRWSLQYEVSFQVGGSYLKVQTFDCFKLSKRHPDRQSYKALSGSLQYSIQCVNWSACWYSAFRKRLNKFANKFLRQILSCLSDWHEGQCDHSESLTVCRMEAIE